MHVNDWLVHVVMAEYEYISHEAVYHTIGIYRNASGVFLECWRTVPFLIDSFIRD